ncbi:hypothetical protein FIBSPDRAFT_322653 [Athelia psychrophila]|uniref:Uncharacterized protein n=1 Tax=Athelia psychrophila TaxID=1759441 RepID=A0A166QKH5_9AGAM|nr:hypothetical protein FIBSPDRAFT_322653 [Fibularhizoctonia sp. CBS 109695]
MALHTLSPFLRPILGPLVGCFINQKVDARREGCIPYMCLSSWRCCRRDIHPRPPQMDSRPPARVHSRREVRRPARRERHRRNEHSAALRTERMTYDRIALLNAWNALLPMISYLAFQAFQFIIAKHGLSAD